MSLEPLSAAPWAFLQHAFLVVSQRKELTELLGLETRNKYQVSSEAGPAAYIAERNEGLLGALARYFLGHFRVFVIEIFSLDRQVLFRARHPFRWLFQRLDIADASGQPMGALQQRFAILKRRFDVLGPREELLLECVSPFFHPWTYTFFQNGVEVAKIEKKWTGTLAEVFTDADNFRVQWAANVPTSLRALILAAAVFVDLQYFEKKA